MNNKSATDNEWLDKDDNFLDVGETESLKSLKFENGNKEKK